MENTTLFTSLTDDQDILKALKKMKFETATPVQAQSIGPMLEGNDITVQAPTGTGKTCAFSIPMIQRIDIADKSVQGLILSPTRELALQIADVIRNLTAFKPGIRVVTIYGGERIEKQFAALRRKPQIVVATPGRLIDHMQRKTIALTSLNTLVLDEADRMLDMGFRPDLNRILKAIDNKHQTALFSATLSAEIRSIAKSYQTNPTTIKIEQGALTVDSVEQFYSIVKPNNKNNELVALFRKEHPKRSMVFSNTKRMCERIVLHLKDEGYRAAYIHGDLRQGQRTRVMSQFKTGRVDILVATDVAARGIDVDSVDMVVNYDIPLEDDSYVHRIGRTGRADQTGVSYTFIYNKERNLVRDLMRTTKANIALVPALSGEVPVISRELLEEDGENKRGRSHKSQNDPKKPRRKSRPYQPRGGKGEDAKKSDGGYARRKPSSSGDAKKTSSAPRPRKPASNPPAGQ